MSRKIGLYKKDEIFAAGVGKDLKATLIEKGFKYQRPEKEDQKFEKRVKKEWRKQDKQDRKDLKHFEKSA